MKARQIFLLSGLNASFLAYGVTWLLTDLDILPKLDLLEILKNKKSGIAGVLEAKPEWKSLVLDGRRTLAVFLSLFSSAFAAVIKSLTFLNNHLKSLHRPFAPLSALKSRREEEFTSLPFVGRETEKAKLNEFLGQSGPLRWMVLNGEPGAGKTRLAYEWALSLKGWSVKVLSPKPDREAISPWKPWRRTLVLVDDYATRNNDIDALLQALPKKHSPVRLLLIDWATPAWLDALPLDTLSGELLTCTDFDTEWFAQLLPAFWPKHRPAPDAAESQRLFQQCGGNPLALGLLLKQPRLASTGSRRQVFRCWAGQVRQDLIAKGLGDDYLPLVALSCWSGDYPWTAIDSARDGYPGKAPERFDLRALAVLPKALPQTIPALRPETLALEYALAEVTNNSPSYRQWLARQAWTANPQGAVRSLWRVHRLALQGLLNEDEQAVFAELNVAPENLAGLDNAAAMQAWEALQTGLKAEAEARKQQAWELANVIHAHGAKGELDLMAAKFEELREMVESWSGDMGLKAVLAAGFLNKTYGYGECGQLALMETALSELRDLTQAYPCEEETHLAMAKSLYNAAHYAGNHGDLRAMAARLDELRILAQAHPGEEPIQLELADGLVSVAHSYGNQGYLQAMMARLDELRSLAQNYPGKTAIQSELAKGLVNATYHYGNQGNLPSMAAGLDELRSQAQANPGETAIQLRLTMGVFNASENYGRQGDLQAMEVSLDELRGLAQGYPGEAEVLLHLASAFLNATNAYGRKGDSHTMAAKLDELRNLAQFHPNNEKIQLLLAMGLRNQTLLDPANASSTIAQIKTLAKRFPAHEGIQEIAQQHGVSFAQQELAKQDS